MMRKYLMTGLVAVALGGLFSSCSKEIETGVENTTEFNILQTYEDAFVTRFGQPAADQDWGFGPASSSTRAVVDYPYVTDDGYTFNTQMTKAWESVVGTPNSMANYVSWRNSGWNDKFYYVHGTVVASNIDANLRQRAYTAILEKIPEGQSNLSKAESTGYSIITEGGPVTLTPIYHNSSSGDKISYYYYPNDGTTPDVKTLPKYTIGNMADPQACSSNHTALNESTYSLVYVGEDGPTYEFPANYVINFMVSNTDLSNQRQTIADDKIVAQKDWTGEANLPGFVEFADNQGSANMVNDGISINVKYTSNYWQPQLSVLDGFNLKAGVNYKVVVVAKFPGDGQLQINMGSWENNKQYNFPVKATGDFQEVVCEFPQNGESYGADITNAHVLFQCGNFLGTTIVKSVKVIEPGTKTIDNTPEFYGDGTYNVAVHNSTIPFAFGASHWGVSPATTPHAAVFNASYKDNGQDVKLNLIGFEDWTDLDFNDVIFAVTGTTGGETIDIPEEEEEEDEDPGDFVCRIIAEDLTVGENSDFDFNDVVFDVFCDGSTTTIRLRAAGGELPLYVAGHEVHQEFGYSNYYPLINTGWDGKSIDYTNRYVDFTIDGVYNDRASAKSIPVMVNKKGKDNVLYEIEIGADKGKVASKVCVGRDYEWCAERQDIDNKYYIGNGLDEGTKLFHQYVIGKLGDDWEHNNAWYQQLGQ